ncbi:MAG: AI-2E family transporter [Balneolaceae bacterium]
MVNNITLDRIVRFVITLAVVMLLVIILYNFGNLVAYVIIAMVISYLLDPMVNRMQAAGMHRTVAITLTLASLILVIIWISTSIIPIIASQMGALTSQLSMENIRFIASEIENMLIDEIEFLPPGFLQENVTRAFGNLFDTGRIPDMLNNLVGIFTNLFAAFLVIPFATFFFLKDGSKIRRDLLQLVPNKYFETTLSLIDKIETRLGVYFRSVLFQSLLVAFFSWVFLSIAGLSNSASVGITIGVANTIPYFGPFIGYILSIIVPIVETGDFSLILPCLLAVFLVQILDNIVFQPLIFSKSAEMHPVAILFIILVGAEAAGILGMLIAIPLATTVKITFTQIRWSFNNYHVYRADPASHRPPGKTMDSSESG